MQNLSAENDDEDDEKKASLRDHRQRASETTSRLEQMSNSASDVRRLTRGELTQLRSDMQGDVPERVLHVVGPPQRR
jgi:hypothetical protein